MTGFKACFLGELKKLAVRKKYIVLSVIAAVICVATMLALGLANRLVGTSNISFTVNMPMMVLPMFVSVFVPLVAMMAVCDLFSTEYHSLSIRAQLMRPVTRFAVYIAKILAPLVLSAIVLAAMFIVAAICSAFGGGADGLLYAFGAYMIDLIPIFILILMAAFINQLTKSPTSAMFLCIVIYVAAKASGFFSAAGSNLLFTSYTEWHRIWLGATLPLGALVAKSALMLGYGITFFSGGYLLFLKKEF